MCARPRPTTPFGPTSDGCATIHIRNVPFLALRLGCPSGIDLVGRRTPSCSKDFSRSRQGLGFRAVAPAGPAGVDALSRVCPRQPAPPLLADLSGPAPTPGHTHPATLSPHSVWPAVAALWLYRTVHGPDLRPRWHDGVYRMHSKMSFLSRFPPALAPLHPSLSLSPGLSHAQSAGRAPSRPLLSARARLPSFFPAAEPLETLHSCMLADGGGSVHPQRSTGWHLPFMAPLSTGTHDARTARSLELEPSFLA
ncbi:hypothetical protein V8E36_003774 [Tilletia maclaganii]